MIQLILAGMPVNKQDELMNRSGTWRSRLMATMLGQLQLATYTAVMLGFTGATSTGLWLSERSRLSVGQDRLVSASESLAVRLKEEGHPNKTERTKEGEKTAESERERERGKQKNREDHTK